MARKLFLSFLGTGLYRKCTYFDEKGEYGETRYIQEATLRQIGATEWEKPNAIRIFITEKAFEDNWDKRETTRKDTIKKEIIPYIRLEQKIEDLHLKADFKAVTNMPVGNGDSEMWQIFQTVFDEIEEGDELYIDLTHAFRYQPMLLLVLSNYSKFLKHTTVKHISYGNFEAKIKRDEKFYAPIVDLMPLISLQDWTTAAADFLNHGDAEMIKAETIKNLRPLFKSGESSENTQNVQKFAKILDTYAKDRLTCRGKNIEDSKTAKTLSNIIHNIENTGIAPLNPIFERIRSSIDNSSDNVERCIEAAKWCFDRKLYQQAITLLREGVISYFCLRHNILLDDSDHRDLVSDAFDILKGKRAEDEWKNNSPEDKRIIKELLQDKELTDGGIVNDFISLRDTRNDFNHAGFKTNAISSDKIIRKIGDSITAFSKLPLIETKPISRQRIFLNLSNHPSESWSEEQKEAAERYGEIIDVPFPAINPDADSDEVKKLAKNTANEIINKYDGDTTDLTVHVMGEMTFTTNLVGILKGCGIRCVASCTKRDVEELGDGKKLATFKFVQFREY